MIVDSRRVFFALQQGNTNTNYIIQVSMLLYTGRGNVQCFTYNLQNRKFMLFIEDDIHFIHAKHHPTSSVTSTTWHMCTAVVDVHDKMDAVDLGDDITKNHSNVQVTMENGSVRPCRGGIDIQHLLGFVSVESGNYYHQSFLQHLPLQFKEFNWSNVEKSFKELR